MTYANMISKTPQASSAGLGVFAIMQSKVSRLEPILLAKWARIGNCKQFPCIFEDCAENVLEPCSLSFAGEYRFKHIFCAILKNHVKPPKSCRGTDLSVSLSWILGV